MWGTDTPAWERERQTHLRQWGQHRAAGRLYLVAGWEGVGSPFSCGRAAGAHMWPLSLGAVWTYSMAGATSRSGQASSRQRRHTARALATSALSSRPQDGSSAFPPP